VIVAAEDAILELHFKMINMSCDWNVADGYLCDLVEGIGKYCRSKMSTKTWKEQINLGEKLLQTREAHLGAMGLQINTNRRCPMPIFDELTPTSIEHGRSSGPERRRSFPSTIDGFETLVA